MKVNFQDYLPHYKMFRDICQGRNKKLKTQPKGEEMGFGQI